MPFPGPVNRETVAAALRLHAGLAVAPDAIRLERRSWRWFATLPDDRILFIADTPESAAQLTREGRLLTLLAKSVSFGLPRVHPIAPSLGLQLRSRVPGAQLAGGGLEREFAERPQGVRLAEDLGRALAELHTACTTSEAQALGFDSATQLLPPAEALATALAGRLTDARIAATFEALLRRYDATAPASGDIVLVHGDIWGGNFAVNLETGALNGLFDFADAGIGDRHLDLMYIHSFGTSFAERLFATYEGKAEITISRPRTALYHAISAFAALAETTNKREDHLLEQRRRWVNDVCHGPIARLALG